MINECYYRTRNGDFYTNRMFVDKNYGKNGQYANLREWKQKWDFIFKNVLKARVAEDDNGRKKESECQRIGIKELLRCLTIWYFHYKATKSKTPRWEVDKEKKSRGDFRAECKKVVDRFGNKELEGLYRGDYKYLIKAAFEELEGIHDRAERMAKGERTEPGIMAGYLDCVRSAMEAIHPPVRRLNFLLEKTK